MHDLSAPSFDHLVVLLIAGCLAGCSQSSQSSNASPAPAQTARDTSTGTGQSTGPGGQAAQPAPPTATTSATIADYDKAASVAPALLDPHCNKGQALEAMGRLTDAVAEYRTVLEKAGSEDSALITEARQRLAALVKTGGSDLANGR